MQDQFNALTVSASNGIPLFNLRKVRRILSNTLRLQNFNMPFQLVAPVYQRRNFAGQEPRGWQRQPAAGP
jgi:hypothetical protein